MESRNLVQSCILQYTIEVINQLLVLVRQVEFGIGKNVVETFPTIKACELKCTATEDFQ